MILSKIQIAFCLVLLASFIGVIHSGAEEEPTSKIPGFLLIELQSSINPGTSDYIKRAIEEAQARGSQALIIELDTPGGLLESTRSIVKLLLNADLPVIVYVAPRGARSGSAGVFITMAGHVAAMAPGTNIGAAHPVTGSGKDPEEEGGKHLAKKIENDTTAFIETIANQRRRNVKWAKDAVLESVSVTERKALSLNVIDFIANDREDLLKKLDNRVIELPNRDVKLRTQNAPIETFDMSLKQYFVDLFSNPNIIYFLLLIATLGIYLELSNPGAILPGVAAGLAIILVLISAQSLPFNVGGLLLMALGAVFFILEVYVTSYGMLALGGIVSFVIGSLLLFDNAEQAFGFLGVSKPIVWVTSLFLIGVVGVTVYLIGRAHHARVSTGYEGLVGQIVEVVQDLAPQGKVRIDGEYWNAQAASQVAKGSKVKVLKAENLMLTVKPVEEGGSASET